MSAPMNSGGSSDAEAVLKKSWFATPIVELDAEKEAWFTFCVALTRHGSDSPADKDGWDDQFMVVVSEDGGKTWKRENAKIWNNETSNDPTDSLYVYGKGDYVLNDLPNVSNVDMPMTISLAKYKGKSVRIAFYSESSVINAYNKIHIGKVHLNYVDYLADEASSCQFEDIVSADGNFYISGDSVTAGTYEYKKIDFASLDDKHVNPGDRLIDTLYTFTAHFNAAPEVLFETTICEGEVAGAEWGFQDQMKSGVYRRKGISVSGCDSITTLKLTVLPILRSEVEVEICSGTTYEFNGKLYDKTGVYVDTLSSELTGCDSITTLILTVAPALTYEYEEYVCSGSTYFFTEKYPALTAAGKYVDTLQTAEGCDSIVTLNLNMIASDTVRVDKVITEAELPYSYPNTTIAYALGTQPGEYIDTVTVQKENDECSYVLIHKLTITSSTDIHNVGTGEITIIPSVIEQGESVTISGVTGKNATVQVYDMVGRCVAQTTMSETSIQINAFTTAGVYMIHVANETGSQFVGRVVVK